MKNILVTGSSGFIGGHLVKTLMAQGHYVTGIDIVEPKYTQPHNFCEFDLTANKKELATIMGYANIDEVYNLACLMGGMGFIGDERHAYDIMVGSTEIVTNVIHASLRAGVKKMFYSSSACVYNMNKQIEEDSPALTEGDAYPALPDLVYGWQKLFSEHLCHSAKSKGLNIKVARFHNIFGTEGTWDGGKEKAPAALCRKVAMAQDGDEIEVWGSGKQTRSFLYIDECIRGIQLLMNSDCEMPINIGSAERISINDLAEMIIRISGKKLTIRNLVGDKYPEGVKGRSSDNTLCRLMLDWAPSEPLFYGMQHLYTWINAQLNP